MAVAAVMASMVGAAHGAPGECTVTGFGRFDCDLTLDGAGLTFTLPDGSGFVFALVEPYEGLGYLISENAKPGQKPRELGSFSPVEGQDGCWASRRDEDYQFCAAVAQ